MDATRIERSMHETQTPTPYSMNRLFSELFRKFEGAFLEVCETISEGIWQVFRGKIKEYYPEKNKKNMKNPISYY